MSDVVIVYLDRSPSLHTKKGKITVASNRVVPHPKGV